jgi:hypothetical protein
VIRLRPHDRSTFTTYNRSEVDCHELPAEIWCVMVSTIGQVITDEHKGLSIVISLA